MINSASITQKTKHCYTMVEMLSVIGLMMIVMGIGSAAISAIITKRGVNGGVSIVNSQVNLARSVAVAKNHYIALLLPAPGRTQNPEDLTSNKLSDRFFKSMRLCYVKRSTDFLGSGHHDINYSTGFVFSDWVEDHYWVDLPSKVCANLVDYVDQADLNSSKRRYAVGSIARVPAGSSTVSCYAIIFNPSGSLVSGYDVLVQVYPGIIKSNGALDMFGLGGSGWRSQNAGKLKNRRWCVEINRFTGRSRTSYAQVGK